MRALAYERAQDASAAQLAVAAEPGTMFLAGGTNLVDLMKLGVHRPDRLIDITGLDLDTIAHREDGSACIGATVRNSALAADPGIREPVRWRRAASRCRSPPRTSGPAPAPCCCRSPRTPSAWSPSGSPSRSGTARAGRRRERAARWAPPPGAGRWTWPAASWPVGSPSARPGSRFRWRGSRCRPTPPTRSGPRGGLARHTFGAHFAEVAVHARTGEVRVRRMLGVFAAGTIINPRTARSQFQGGMIMAHGQALLERGEVDPGPGDFANHDLASYHIPAHADVGSLEVVMLHEHDRSGHPVGVKGIGELSMMGGAAAIANALSHAVGRRFRDVPIRIEDVRSVLGRQ